MAKKSRNKDSSSIPQSSNPISLFPQITRVQLVLGSVVIGIVTFLIYVLTTYPETAGGDTGELIVVAQTWGIAHPPGYPLFTLLGKLFSGLPWGSVAKRVNLMSGVFDAGAAVLLFLAVAKWTRNFWAGILSAGIFAFSPLVWSYAVAAEVFPINNFFGAGLLLLSVLYFESRQRSLVYFSAFWFGLGLSNHHTLIFYGIPVGIWMIWIARSELLAVRPLVCIFALFASGFLPYLYLPIASSRIPLWGWGDQTSLDGFLTHILRTEYGTFKLVRGEGEDGLFIKLLWNYLKSLPIELNLIGFGLAGLGLSVALKKQSRNSLSLIWAASFGFYTLTFLLLSNVNLQILLSVTVQSRFYQQSNLILAAMAGLGFATLAQKFRNIPKWIMPGIAGIAVLFQVAIHYREQDQSRNRNFAEFGRAVLKNLPTNAILISQGDHIQGSVRYLRQVEGYRTDVKMIGLAFLTFTWSKRWVNQHFPDVILPKRGMYLPSDYNMKDFIEANLPLHPIFVVNGFYPWDQSPDQTYKRLPWGLSERIVPQNVEIDPSEWINANGTVFDGLNIEQLGKYPLGTWEASLTRSYLTSAYLFGTHLLTQAVAQSDNPQLLKKGLKLLEWDAEYYPDVHIDLFKNLGVAYQHASKFDPSASQKIKQAWTRYLSFNPPESAELRAIRSYLGK